jgi:hypothetical protein
MSTYPKPSEPHQFVISDEDLFVDNQTTTKDIRIVSCYVCGDKPGQGMHAPPPPPEYVQIVDGAAKALSGTAIARHLNWDQLKVPGAQVAFTVLVHLRSMLKEMGKNDVYSDPHDMGDPFSDIDDRLDNLLTDLRSTGWNEVTR